MSDDIDIVRRCQKCGEPTGGEEAWIQGQIWCHPCADALETDAMSNDIVKRLRDEIDVDVNEHLDRLLEEAADEIERLTAENARLVSICICNGTVWEDNERLLEENRKLRAALSQQYATTASLLRSDQMPSEG